MAQGGRKLDLKKAVALVKLLESSSASAGASGERSGASLSTSSSSKHS
jgi:hypothetical protein